MRIFAIGDLHLPGDAGKTMDIFGANWDGHMERIASDWLSRVGADDVVLLPGDFSWSQDIDGVKADILQIGELPGKKILIRGNHDYWWNSITKVRQALPENMYALQNDSIQFENVIICGSRGWTLPDESSKTYAEDLKIYSRELIRMRLSLEHACKSRTSERLVVMTHYPPLFRYRNHTELTKLFCEFGVHDVVYGHLHGEGIANGFSGIVDNTRYHLASCDALDFRLLEISP
ncbi:MAG: metallophosphoesterase [Oscillospiraceae bacterium]|jgi:predicted phosphohydrolase|nr:metallophosphoesterase [Oscillospiraceae bacterium]